MRFVLIKPLDPILRHSFEIYRPCAELERLSLEVRFKLELTNSAGQVGAAIRLRREVRAPVGVAPVRIDRSALAGQSLPLNGDAFVRQIGNPRARVRRRMMLRIDPRLGDEAADLGRERRVPISQEEFAPAPLQLVAMRL